MPSEVMTMCFHTRDAVERKNGSFTFHLPGSRLRNEAAKVALASCEFPMVQWTVEDEWNRLYVNEGISLTPDMQTCKVFCNDSLLFPVHLPLCINPVQRASVHGNRVTITCRYPHGLHEDFANDALYTHNVRLLGSSEGDISLTDLHARKRVRAIDETTLEVRQTCADATRIHSLVMSKIHSPHQLAAWIHTRLHMQSEFKFSIGYKASHDRMTVEVTAPSNGDNLRFGACPLVHMCGISTMSVRVQNFRASWPTETTSLWDYVCLPSGFYAPCHRPMCTGQPMRLGGELETVANRLYFPIVKSGEPKHQLIFSDASGRVVACHIPQGRYTPTSLCKHLTQAMTSAIQTIDPTIEYTVYHNEQHYFTFVCERRTSVGVTPAPFSILFHHPLCIDGARLGFPSQPLNGSDTYVATDPCRFARGVDGRYSTNIVRVSEVSHQKRFSIHVTAPPSMIAVTLGGASARHIRVRTHVNRTPFSHGLQPGDFVTMSECGNVTVNDDEGAEKSVDGIGTSLPRRVTCIVTEETSDTFDPTVLVLLAPPLDGMDDADKAIQLTCLPDPWNMCLDVHPTSIPAHLLGYPRGATQYGLDGSVGNSHGVYLPPFLAPHSHTLDHPDYVLMTFSESSGAVFEHSYGNENKSIFCKLSLYPLFREERMLPRDTTLLSNQMNTFTLSFWNPDLATPYHFHGCDFSFSLNFVSAVPE